MGKFAVDGPNRRKHFQPSFSFFGTVSLSAQIAQLVEHVLGKDEVAGSTPVLGSMLKNNVGLASTT
jgi:hypothetical protein